MRTDKLDTYFGGAWIALAALLLASPLFAQEPFDFESPEQEARFQELTLELRCAVCQNQNLADSDAPLAQDFAARLLDEGIYVIGFFYPVVPKGEARIRVQVSAAHETEHLDRAVEAFTKVGRELGVLD